MVPPSRISYLDCMNPHIRRVRWVGLVEGTSALLLFFVAMPLKYLADMPGPTTVIGSIHGALFVLYAAVVLWAWACRKLSFGWVLLLALASIVPVGPFIADARLKRLENAKNDGGRPVDPPASPQI
jgi:integral membrane protein